MSDCNKQLDNIFLCLNNVSENLNCLCKYFYHTGKEFEDLDESINNLDRSLNDLDVCLNDMGKDSNGLYRDLNGSGDVTDGLC